MQRHVSSEQLRTTRRQVALTHEEPQTDPSAPPIVTLQMSTEAVLYGAPRAVPRRSASCSRSRRSVRRPGEEPGRRGHCDHHLRVPPNANWPHTPPSNGWRTTSSRQHGHRRFVTLHRRVPPSRARADGRLLRRPDDPQIAVAGSRSPGSSRCSRNASPNCPERRRRLTAALAPAIVGAWRPCRDPPARALWKCIEPYPGHLLHGRGRDRLHRHRPARLLARLLRGPGRAAGAVGPGAVVATF